VIPKNLYLAKNFRIEYKNTLQNLGFQKNINAFHAKKILNTFNRTVNPFQTFVKSLLLSA